MRHIKVSVDQTIGNASGSQAWTAMAYGVPAAVEPIVARGPMPLNAACLVLSLVERTLLFDREPMTITISVVGENSAPTASASSHATNIEPTAETKEAKAKPDALVDQLTNDFQQGEASQEAK